jgi:hypothetical protein
MLKTCGSIDKTKGKKGPAKTDLRRSVFLCSHRQLGLFNLEAATGIFSDGATSYNISNSNYTNGLGYIKPFRLYPIVALKRSRYGVSYFSTK